MRIVHYIEYLNTKMGGPIRATLDLCGGLASRGHEVLYLTRDVASAPKDWVGSVEDAKAGRVVVVRLPGDERGAGPLKPDQREVAKRALRGAACLHLHGMWKVDNIQLARMARSQGTPYIVSLRGMLDDWCMEQRGLRKRIFLTVMGRAHLEGAALVHCTAEGEKRQSVKWFPKGRPLVLHNFLNLTPYRALPGPEPARRAFPRLAEAHAAGTPVVLFLSRIHYKKGADVLLDAARLLRERGRACLTVIAGDGEEAYVKQVQGDAARMGLSAHTLFTGHLDGELKVSLYQAADVFALPTSQENFGFVFPESLASGTPVITTKGVDIWPELESSGGAVIVDRTPQAFADAIATVLGDPAKRSAMSQRGRAFVFEMFDDKRLLDEYVGMYERAASASG